MEIGVPRVSHPETRPAICSADLNEANCCCNKIALLALVKARVAVLCKCESRLARGGRCGLCFCFGTRTFDPVEVRVTANWLTKLEGLC